MQIDRYGNFKISGERPVVGSENRWIRFLNDFHVSKNITIEDIKAKFEDGLLTVVVRPNEITNKTLSTKAITGDRIEKKTPKNKKETNASSPNHTIAKNSDTNNRRIDESRRQNKFVLLNVVVGATVVLGVGIYVGYKLGKRNESNKIYQ